MVKKILFFFFIVLSYQATGQNDLEKAKQNVAKSKTNTSSSSYNDTYNKHRNQNEDYKEDSASFFENVFFEVAYALTIGLVQVTFIDTPPERESLHASTNISEFPYVIDSIGGFNPYYESKKARWHITDRYLMNSDLQGNYFRTELQFAKRFSLMGDITKLVEQNPNVPNTEYTQYTMMANYYRLRGRRWSIWYGIGARYIGEGIDKFGFAYNFGTRIYVTKPLSLETSFIGSDVNGSAVHHFNSHVKWHLNRFYISAGYDKHKISSSDFHMFGTGIGIYF